MKNKTKTIFISIPLGMMARNFILFPESVLDILQRDKNIKIIIVTSPQMIAQFFNNLSPGKLDNNVVIEKIEKIAKTKWYQELFKFFYSYLIFVGTTRLLATRGARPDVEPAGGKNYLYFLKWLNYKIFGWSKWIKNKLVPKLYLKIFKERPYKYLFDKHSPNLVFLPNIAHNPDLELSAECKRRNIKTIGMPGSWDHFNKYFVPLKSDYLLAWNEPLKKEAIDYEGYEEKNIKLVGFPQFDFLIKKEFILPREEFLKKIGFPLDKKIITFASAGVLSLDGADIVDMIVKWIESKELPDIGGIILRPYPRVKSEKERYSRFEGNPLVYIDWINSWSTRENVINFINVIYHADIVINTFSTISVEAGLFDRPIINIAFDGYQKRPAHQSVKRFFNFSHYKHVLDTGAARTVENQEELLEALKKYLANPEIDRDKRKLLREKMVWKLDGLASKRIADFIKSYLIS